MILGTRVSVTGHYTKYAFQAERWARLLNEGVHFSCRYQYAPDKLRQLPTVRIRRPNERPLVWSFAIYFVYFDQPREGTSSHKNNNGRLLFFFKRL